MKLKNDTRRFNTFAQAVFVFSALFAFGVTFWIVLTPRAVLTPEMLERFHGHDFRPPDWLLVGTSWLVVFSLWVIQRTPHALHFGKAYLRKEGKAVHVGTFACPQCKTNFTRDGYCSFCLQDPPKLVFHEQTWHS